MNEKILDIIGIGAINFDFIFNSDPGKDLGKPQAIERGTEGLSTVINIECVERMILQNGCTTQIGGSALLTIKTISSLNIGLRTAYVGCYGTPDKLEKLAGFPDNIDEEFAYISNRDWLFKTNDKPGRAIVKLHKGKRLSIDISPGANNKLKEKIIEKEKSIFEDGTTNTLFVQFLSNSKWIHLTSLADIEQFKFIIEKLKEAKTINPLLKISIDPGYEYTKSHSHTLKEIFSVADFIFLNENEFNNIAGSNEFDFKTKVDILKNIVAKANTKDTLVFIQKGISKNMLLNFINGRPFSRSFWHPKLSHMRIYNDTGAGDVFAGGVIAGVLSPHLLTHQPASIKLGAILAAIRLKSKNFPEKELSIAYNHFIENNLKNESTNYNSRTKAFWEKWGKYLTGFFIGLLTSSIVSLFFYLLKSY